MEINVICAWCKRGMGHKSGFVGTSHGICPDCLKTMLPADDVQPKRRTTMHSDMKLTQHDWNGETYYIQVMPSGRTYYSFDMRHWHRQFRPAAEAVGFKGVNA